MGGDDILESVAADKTVHWVTSASHRVGHGEEQVAVAFSVPSRVIFLIRQHGLMGSADQELTDISPVPPLGEEIQ